jgi:putative ABC transport system permease protein
MDTLIHNLRYALRTLGRNPLFTTVTILTMALGIGANLAIFAVVNAVLLRPLPFPHPERIVRVFDDAPGAGAHDIGMSVPELIDLADRSGVFAQISALIPVSTALAGGDRVERIELLGTSPNYFEMLGAKAALGRVYTQAEWQPGFLDGVLISDALWRREFGADPKVIGRRIRVDEDPYTIIGVMPPEFRHPGNTSSSDVDLWAAAGFIAAPFPSPPIRRARVFNGALARLSAGVSLEDAQRRLDLFVAQLQRAYPNDYPAQLKWTLRLEPAQASLTGNVRPLLVLLLAAVGFVLLIMCVNMASLLIARASTRTRELAIRQALGASRRRLAEQVLIESALISLAGGVAAVLLLHLARGSLLSMLPADLPRVVEIHTDWRLVAFALALSLGTGLLFGLMPAIHAAGIDPLRGLNEGGRGGGQHGVRQRRVRTVLVVLEVAVSVVLLTGAGLLVRSFVAVMQQDPGLATNGLIAGQIWVPVPNNPAANRYLTPPQQAALARRLLDAFVRLPGVEAAAVGTANDVPFLNNQGNAFPFSLPDESTTQEQNHAAQFGSVSPRYFDVLKTPLKRGRFFTDHDDSASTRVVVVNEAFVRQFSRDRDPVGRRVRLGKNFDLEIVGVAGDVRYGGLDQLPQPRIYSSILQRGGVQLAVFFRTRSTLKTTRDALTAAVHDVDPELPVFGVRTMDELMSSSLARRQFALKLISIFALSALLLAALGIYGVMTYLVSQRAQEFGVRLALGAVQRDIVSLVLAPGLALTGLGVVLGLGASLLTSRMLAALVYGVSAVDPVTLGGVAAVLALVTLAACFLPVRQATRVSPMEALRS